MPRVMETVVYRIDELEDDAKGKAREWWCCSFDDDWHESVIDDFCRICSILGVQLKTTARSLYGGGTREEPSVWVRGALVAQGGKSLDGACFEGRYAYQHCHSHSMDISVRRDSPTGQDCARAAEEEIAEAMRDLADWLFSALEREYEYQISDAVVDEVLSINGYTFTSDGRRFG